VTDGGVSGGGMMYGTVLSCPAVVNLAHVVEALARDLEGLLHDGLWYC